MLDVLVFDPPGADADALGLELAADRVGRAGTFRIRIQRAVWDRPAH